MGVSFEWDDPQKRDEEPRDKTRQSGGPSGRVPRAVMLLAVLLLVGAAGALALLAVRWWMQPDSDELQTAVRLQLEAEASAVSTGNHDLFLSLHQADPAWTAARYGRLPASGEPSWDVVSATPAGEHIHATLGRRDGNVDYRKAAFFQFHQGRLIRTATSPSYWGELQTATTDWGALAYHAPDQGLVEAVDRAVAEAVGQACSQGCISARLPFTLYLAGDFTAVHPGMDLVIPSPRLTGITSAGRPHPDFDRHLQQLIAARLLPVTVRFGVPDALIEQADMAANAFMAAHPQTTIDLIPLSLLSADPVELLTQVDAAMIPPTPALITGGHIVDLTEYALATDSFAYDELYGMARTGSHWQARLWSAPQHAEFRVLYSDHAAFAPAVMSPEEYLGRLWSADTAPEPETRNETLSPETSAELVTAANTRWQLMDVSRHSLFAFAYDQRCRQDENRKCDDPLSAGDLAATLDWYAGQLEMGIMPDVTGMNEEERKFFALNQLGYPRKVILWFETLGTYEHNTQLGVLDVTASPGVDGAGITPFAIVGSVMSTRTAAPQATWQWLAHLSTWRPMGTARSMPVRASTATEIGYWSNLPPPLQPVVRTAFARGRGIGIEENGYFDWPLVHRVVVGEITPEEGATLMAAPGWFGRR